MKQGTKRTLALLLTLVMLLGLLPATALAEEAEAAPGQTESRQTLQTEAGAGAAVFSQAEELPAVIDGSCGAKAADSVAWKLETGSGVLTISGTGAMADYKSSKTTAPWLAYKDVITSVIVESGVTYIGNYAFYKCEALTRVVLADSVTGLGTNVFEGCTALKAVTLSKGLTALKNYTFRNCGALESVTFPGGMTSIGNYAFAGCASLKELALPASLTSLGTYVFQNCAALTSVTIPDGIQKLDNFSFSGCAALKTVVLPDTVKTLGTNVFKDCTGLTDVTMNGVSQMNTNVFSGCTALTALLIPEQVTVLPDGAFAGCTGLQGELVLPERITKLGNQAFKGCTGLTRVLVPDTVTALGSEVFSGCTSLTEAALPVNQTVTTVPQKAFSNCVALSHVTLPAQIVTIDKNAFEGCAALTAIALPEALTTVNESAFAGAGLTAIDLPDTVKTLGKNVFANCTGLTSLAIPGAVKNISAATMLAGCTNLKTLILKEGIENVSASLGLGACGVETIHLPASLTAINPRAFRECESLTALTVAEGGQFMAENGLLYSGDKKTLSFCAPGLSGAVTVADGTETIGKDAFYYCRKLTGIQLPQSLATVGEYAFYECPGVKSLTIPDSVTSVGKYAFSSFTGSGFESITLPSGLTEIADLTFNNCKALKTLEIPDTVTSIGRQAFGQCESLTELKLPASLKTMGSNAFQKCASLTSVTIPDGVTAIPASAFSGCTQLNDLYLPAGIATVAGAAFKDCAGLSTVYFTGTQEQWDAVKITAKDNAPLTNATVLCGYKGIDETLPSAVIAVQPVSADYEKNAAAGGSVVASRRDGNTSTCTPATDSFGTKFYYCVITRAVDGYYAPNTVSQVAQIKVSPFEGAGTEELPYKIASLEHLQTLAQLVKEGNTMKDTWFQMTEDVTLPQDWEPLGALKEGETSPGQGKNVLPFSGIFDGDGHTLTVAKGGRPLLGYVRGATVKNLKIYGEQIESCGLLEHYYRDYGPTGTSSSGEFGAANGYYFTVDSVTLKSGTKTLESGLLGNAVLQDATAQCPVRIVNCTVEEGVTIGYTKDKDYIGSLAGKLNGEILGCVSYADVYGRNCVGGLVGEKDAAMGDYSVKNSAFLGSVTGTGKNVGGIAGSGYSDGSAPNTRCVTIENCYVDAVITGEDNVGGILGAEPVISQCWANGKGYLRNNHFYGQLVSGGTCVGGIVGYMKSLNVYTTLENNFFLDSCGSGKGIGGVLYVDTSAAHEQTEGVLYFSTASGVSGCPEVYGCEWQAGLNRKDDPLGADKDKLAQAVTAEQMRDGTVTGRLNASDSSMKNWIQGETYPELSKDPVAIKLEISGSYKTEYWIGESLDLTGAVFTVAMSDGSTKTVEASAVTVSGFDSSKRAVLTLTASYGTAQAEFTVRVLKKPETSDTITISFTLLGDAVHDTPTEATGTHTLKSNNLVTWLPKKDYAVGANDTVWEALQKVMRAEAGLVFSNPTGRYIDAVTYGETTLAALDNGDLSGWMYTLNGTHPALLVSEQFLENGDTIVFHYTDDYTVEEGSEPWWDENHPADTTADRKAASAVEELIKAIGAVDTTSGDKIEAARKAYDQLTQAQKKLVSNYNVLVRAESAYAEATVGVPFVDAAGHWALEPIRYVYQHKLFQGIDAATFAPDKAMSRAMLVTVLYRMAGAPAVAAANPFADVKDGRYYTDAVLWAVENHIVNGVTEDRFDPDADITREQMAAMMMRYAAYEKKDTAKSAELEGYADAAQIAPWALEAMKWANGEKLILGRTETSLAPQGTATRAEAAAILMRFAEGTAK